MTGDKSNRRQVEGKRKGIGGENKKNVGDKGSVIREGKEKRLGENGRR